MAAPTLGTNWYAILQSLEKDWDSYGAAIITTAALQTLAAFSVVPCSSGGIQLEVHCDGYDIEIEIDPRGNIDSVLVEHERQALDA